MSQWFSVSRLLQTGTEFGWKKRIPLNFTAALKHQIPLFFFFFFFITILIDTPILLSTFLILFGSCFFKKKIILKKKTLFFILIHSFNPFHIVNHNNQLFPRLPINMMGHESFLDATTNKSPIFPCFFFFVKNFITFFRRKIFNHFNLVFLSILISWFNIKFLITSVLEFLDSSIV